jgi:hypothetical protein
MNMLALYGALVLAFIAGFSTCALLCFGKVGDGGLAETTDRED